MSKDGIIALIASLVIIAGAVFWFTTYGPLTDAVDGGTEAVQNAASYATEDDFPNIESASGEEIERALINSFDAGRLLQVVHVDIPDTDGDQLVLATPTKSGQEEPVDCDIRGHRYCGLYRKSKNGNQLVLWGSKLAGFAGVERFIDPDHAIIGSAWSMLNFTSIERHQLNLQTGELIPKLLIELDVGDDFSELQASGYGEVISLWIEGSYETGNLIPERILVRNAENEDEVYRELDAEEVAHLAAEARASDERIDPVFVLPTDEDVQTLSIQMELYGRPYELDLMDHYLRRIETEGT